MTTHHLLIVACTLYYCTSRLLDDQLAPRRRRRSCRPPNIWTYADDWNQSRLRRWLLAYYYFILFDQPEKGAKARKRTPQNYKNANGSWNPMKSTRLYTRRKREQKNLWSSKQGTRRQREDFKQQTFHLQP